MDNSDLFLAVLILALIFYVYQCSMSKTRRASGHMCDRQCRVNGCPYSPRAASYAEHDPYGQPYVSYFNPEETFMEETQQALRRDPNSGEQDVAYQLRVPMGGFDEMTSVAGSVINDNTEEGMANYDSYVALNSLESSVYDSHNAFVSDMQNRVAGASAQSINSSDVDINPWVGLRRPNYQAAVPDANARVVPSHDPHQMPAQTRGFGCLVPY